MSPTWKCLLVAPSSLVKPSHPQNTSSHPHLSFVESLKINTWIIRAYWQKKLGSYALRRVCFIMLEWCDMLDRDVSSIYDSSVDFAKYVLFVSAQFASGWWSRQQLSSRLRHPELPVKILAFSQSRLPFQILKNIAVKELSTIKLVTRQRHELCGIN